MYHLTLTDEQVALTDGLAHDPDLAWLHAAISTAHHVDERGAILITIGDGAEFDTPLQGLCDTNVDIGLRDGTIVPARIVGWSRTDEGWEAIEVYDVDKDYEPTGRPSRLIDVAIIDRIEYA